MLHISKIIQTFDQNWHRYPQQRNLFCYLPGPPKTNSEWSSWSRIHSIGFFLQKKIEKHRSDSTTFLLFLLISNILGTIFLRPFPENQPETRCLILTWFPIVLNVVECVLSPPRAENSSIEYSSLTIGTPSCIAVLGAEGVNLELYNLFFLILLGFRTFNVSHY